MRHLRRVMRLVKRALRAARIIASHTGLPRWLRVLFVIGCLPIPGPFDECVLLIAVGIMAIFYRPTLLITWAEAES